MPEKSTRLVRLSEIAATPWKNGGGVTREIATGARPDGKPGWGWRVSLADVTQDGPFSIFPETDRVIAVIEGAGMDLMRPDGTTLALESFLPVSFAGEDAFQGRLRDGAVRDLNVMVLRAHFAAEMVIRQGPSSFDVETGKAGCLVVHCLAGRCSVGPGDAKSRDLHPAESLIHEGPGIFHLTIASGSRAAVIRILRR